MWLRSVKHWVAFKEMDRAEKAKSFPVMLRGSALVWYDNVDDDVKDDFDLLTEAFLDRYHIVGVTGWKDAASMWSTPQLPHQSVDDYLNQMERKASKTTMPDDQKRFAVINGLRYNIRQQVLQHEIINLSQIRHWATIAEASENQGDAQNEIANLSKQLKVLTEQLSVNKINVLAEAEEKGAQKVRFQEAAARARTPSPRPPPLQQYADYAQNEEPQVNQSFYPTGQFVRQNQGGFQRRGPTHFLNSTPQYQPLYAPQNFQPQLQYPPQNFQGPAEYPQQNFQGQNRPLYNPRWGNFQNFRPRAPNPQGQCRSCWQRHPLYMCPAKNVQCRACGRYGHMTRACLSVPLSN